MYKRKTIILMIISVIAILCIYLIGPGDVFVNGFNCSPVAYDQIPAEKMYHTVSLENQAYETIFVPQEKHFAGVEVILNNPAGNSGKLILEICKLNGKIIKRTTVQLNKVPSDMWYSVYASAELKPQTEYMLRIKAEEYKFAPELYMVDDIYLPVEAASGNLLISYAYAESSLTLSDKILFILYVIVFWLAGCTIILRNTKYAKIVKTSTVLLFLTVILTWNYVYNSMDDQNSAFGDFQSDSESIVMNVLAAEHNAVEVCNFGLGFYSDVTGTWYPYSYARTSVTNDSFINGYSLLESAIGLNESEYTKMAALTGNYVSFPNGDVLRITDVQPEQVQNGDKVEKYLKVYLDTTDIMDENRYGNINGITFLNAQKESYPVGMLTPYTSQYGLQGKVFRHLMHFIKYENAVTVFHVLCSIAAASVFVIIVFMLYKKYDLLFAGCFYITFWLSPWIVNFARNLYWLEFLWFAPMAIGLFCAWKINSRKCRIASYVAAFIAITVKCLCGYEYISSIMLGLIAFLLIDLLIALAAKQKKKLLLLFRTILIIGVIALLGFFAAICMHAVFKGNGQLLEGIKRIIQEDVLRRTSGGNLSDFDSANWPAFNASYWTVICKYFKFSTQIIVGIQGNVFPVLCSVPILIFIYDICNNKVNIQWMSMYLVFFITAISWFVLAKSHSYFHTHINFVLWYFGYIQVCFYIIIQRCIQIIRKR